MLKALEKASVTSFTQAPSKKHKKVEPVSPENEDEWVYEFSNDAMGGVAHAAQKKSTHHSKHHKKHHKHHKRSKSADFLQYNKENGLWMTK